MPSRGPQQVKFRCNPTVMPAIPVRPTKCQQAAALLHIPGDFWREGVGHVRLHGKQTKVVLRI